ncbi:MAG: hypothetical protein IJQ26_04530, partial [Lachnospiraceae bacterium]|nr:hypothetical protein [Lachnospiraceae bacterium]
TIFLAKKLRTDRCGRLMLVECINAHFAALELTAAHKVVVQVIFGQGKSGGLIVLRFLYRTVDALDLFLFCRKET